MAKRLGYHNMTFQQADLRNYMPPERVTAVISLHACDIATDLALATAIRGLKCSFHRSLSFYSELIRFLQIVQIQKL